MHCYVSLYAGCDPYEKQAPGLWWYKPDWKEDMERDSEEPKKRRLKSFALKIERRGRAGARLSGGPPEVGKTLSSYVD